MCLGEQAPKLQLHTCTLLRKSLSQLMQSDLPMSWLFHKCRHHEAPLLMLPTIQRQVLTLCSRCEKLRQRICMITIPCALSHWGWLRKCEGLASASIASQASWEKEASYSAFHGKLTGKCWINNVTLIHTPGVPAATGSCQDQGHRTWVHECCLWLVFHQDWVCPQAEQVKVLPWQAHCQRCVGRSCARAVWLESRKNAASHNLSRCTTLLETCVKSGWGCQQDSGKCLCLYWWYFF